MKKSLKNIILDYEQVNKKLDNFLENKIFTELKDLGNTEYGLPIRHFTIGKGNNDIVITRCNTWK